MHYAGGSVAAVRVRRTTRIEAGLGGVGSLAETIDPLGVTQSPGISPAFDRQTRQPRSHYFALESVRSCGANEKLRGRRPRQRFRSGSSPWFWHKPASIVARLKHHRKPGLDAVWLQPATHRVALRPQAILHSAPFEIRFYPCAGHLWMEDREHEAHGRNETV